MRELRGNLLNATENIIMHQVNCKGVMGAGVAYQIRRYLLSDYEYERYRDLCKNHTAKELLGKYISFSVCKNRILYFFCYNAGKGGNYYDIRGKIGALG